MSWIFSERALVCWGRRAGFRLEVVGVDNNPAVIAYAREACRDYPEITLIQSDFEDFSRDAVPLYDYALSSLALHHLSNAEVIALLQISNRVARRGMIMNDLKRSVRAWAWIWTLSRIFPAHPIVQNDAPLSVRRAFRPDELEYLAAQASLDYVKVTTHFGYRLVLAGEKLNDHFQSNTDRGAV